MKYLEIYVPLHALLHTVEDEKRKYTYLQKYWAGERECIFIKPISTSVFGNPLRVVNIINGPRK